MILLHSGGLVACDSRCYCKYVYMLFPTKSAYEKSLIGIEVRETETSPRGNLLLIQEKPI